MTHQPRPKGDAAGFSLVELLIAMTVMIVAMGLASTMLARSFGIRTREDQRTDAIADAQRALNIMSRELANAGFGLTDNGLVGGDCGSGTTAADQDRASIRFQANINAYQADPAGGSMTLVDGDDEDVKYLMYVDDTNNRRYLVRYAKNIADPNRRTTVLANRIDALQITYFDAAGNQLNVNTVPASAASAARLLITVGVTLPALGVPGAPNYQPPGRVQLTSEVVLRNARLLTY